MSRFRSYAINFALAAYLLVVSAPVSASVTGYTEIKWMVQVSKAVTADILSKQ